MIFHVKLLSPALWSRQTKVIKITKSLFNNMFGMKMHNLKNTFDIFIRLNILYLTCCSVCIEPILLFTFKTFIKNNCFFSFKFRSHCPGELPGAYRQFVAGEPGRTWTIRQGIRVWGRN